MKAVPDDFNKIAEALTGSVATCSPSARRVTAVLAAVDTRHCLSDIAKLACVQLADLDDEILF